MRRRKLSIVVVLLVLSISASTAFAGNVHLSGVSFSLGSLITKGTMSGLGSTDVTVVLDASGIPEVICTNQGGNQAPGQNPPKVKAEGTQALNHATYTKNGTSPFGVETLPPDVSNLTAVQLGCPNNNWTATLTGFVYWTNATITVKATSSGAILLQQNYLCATTKNPNTVSCTPTK